MLFFFKKKEIIWYNECSQKDCEKESLLEKKKMLRKHPYLGTVDIMSLKTVSHATTRA